MAFIGAVSKALTDTSSRYRRHGTRNHNDSQLFTTIQVDFIIEYRWINWMGQTGSNCQAMENLSRLTPEDMAQVAITSHREHGRLDTGSRLSLVPNLRPGHLEQRISHLQHMPSVCPP